MQNLRIFFSFLVFIIFCFTSSGCSDKEQKVVGPIQPNITKSAGVIHVSDTKEDKEEIPELPSTKEMLEGTKECSACGKPATYRLMVDVKTEAGDYVFCSPVCAAGYIHKGLIDPQKDTIRFRGFMNAEPISLEKVLIVVESDIECPTERSAVAVGSKEKAKKLIAQRGGQTLTWDEFLDSEDPAKKEELEKEEVSSEKKL